MTIFTLVASHQSVDLETVAQLSNGVIGLPEYLREENIDGSVVLSTCNRLELYVEVTTPPSSTEQFIATQVATISEKIFDYIARTSSLSLSVVATSFETFIDDRAAHHLFTVASGLESAVVGEREITGQVRRAISTAQDDGYATGNLVRLFDRGAHTARQVGQQTALGSRGRSVVSVALDLADEVSDSDWAHRTTLVFGTGAYAGATMAALRDRGCTEIYVYSRSNRAETFTEKRGGSPVPLDQLHPAMEKADVIIGCSGGSTPLHPNEIPAGKRVILDLALTRDFDPAVADMPEIDLITLESVRLAAPEETAESVETARTIVNAASADFAQKEKARNVDAAIVALRAHTMSVLETELQKVRGQFGCGAAAEQVEFAMRRMVKSLLHTPTVRARELAQEGRTADYIAALDALYGIDVQQPQVSEQKRNAS